MTTNETKHDAVEDVITSEDDDVWNMVVPHAKDDARSAAASAAIKDAAVATADEEDAKEAKDLSAAAAEEDTKDAADEEDAKEDAAAQDTKDAAAAEADDAEEPEEKKTRCCRYKGDVLDNLAEPTLDAKNAADVRARIFSAADANAKTPTGLQIVRRVMDAYGRTVVELVYQNAAGVVLGAFKATAVDEKDVEIACLGCAERVNSSMDDIEAHVKDGPPTKHAVKFLKVRLEDGATASLAEVVNNNARQSEKGGQKKAAAAAATAGAKRKSGASSNANANVDVQPNADANAEATNLRKAVVKHAYVLRDARRAEDIPDLLDAVDRAEAAGRAERARLLLGRDCAALVDAAFGRVFAKDREAVTADHVAEMILKGPPRDDEDRLIRDYDVAYTLPESIVAVRRACRDVAGDVLVALPAAAMRACAAPVEVYDVAAAAVEAAAPLFARHGRWSEYARLVRDFASRAAPRDVEEEELQPPEPEDDLIRPERFGDARAWIHERAAIALEVGRQAARAIELARDGCLSAALLQACAQCAKDAAAAEIQVDRNAALADMKTINDGAQVAKRRKTAA